MAAISAQVSLYPLRHEQLSPIIDEALKEFRGQGLEVHPGTMSTLVLGSEESVFSALREAFGKATRRGEVVMVVTVSNACPVSTQRSSPA
jgi:uncharacterized protein YqgV (UPF0045/DUF77 family)